MFRNQSIGIIGGMGPRAAVDFEKRLLDSYPGGDQDMPSLITVNAGEIPDRTEYLLTNGENPAPAIQSAIDRLVGAGAELLVMPCNTAHAPQIMRQLSFRTVPFLHMPRLVADRVAQSRVERIGLLATSGTVKAQTYQELLVMRGVEVVHPSEETQQLVTACIEAIKQGDAARGSVLAMRILEAVRDMQLDACILGCTELSSIEEVLSAELQTFDTLNILAEETRSYTIGTKERQNELRRIYT